MSIECQYTHTKLVWLNRIKTGCRIITSKIKIYIFLNKLPSLLIYIQNVDYIV